MTVATRYNEIYDLYGDCLKGMIFKSSYDEYGIFKNKPFIVVDYTLLQRCYDNVHYYRDIKIKYVETGYTKTFSELSSVGCYFEEQNNEENNMPTNTLYKNTDNNRFGYIIGKDRSSQTVFQYQDNNEITTLDKSKLEEVVQYTFELTFCNGNSPKHYATKEGLISKGDVLLTHDGKFGTVTKLDTKNKSANEFKGSRMVTEALGEIV